MSQPAVVPIPPDLTARYTRSSAGRAWLASLPDLIQGRLDNWELTPDLRPGALPWNGSTANARSPPCPWRTRWRYGPAWCGS